MNEKDKKREREINDEIIKLDTEKRKIHLKDFEKDIKNKEKQVGKVFRGGNYFLKIIGVDKVEGDLETKMIKMCVEDQDYYTIDDVIRDGFKEVNLQEFNDCIEKKINDIKQKFVQGD